MSLMRRFDESAASARCFAVSSSQKTIPIFFHKPPPTPLLLRERGGAQKPWDPTARFSIQGWIIWIRETSDNLFLKSKKNMEFTFFTAIKSFTPLTRKGKEFKPTS